MEDFASHWKKWLAEDLANLHKNLKIVTNELQKLGVDFVRMTYDGGGDSGDYHCPIYTVGDEELEDRSGAAGCSEPSDSLDSTGEFYTDAKVFIYTTVRAVSSTEGAYDPISTSVNQVSLLEAVSQMLIRAVESRYAGWYNDEGGHGSTTFDVKRGVIEVEHGMWVQSTEWDHYTVGEEDIEVPDADLPSVP